MSSARTRIGSPSSMATLMNMPFGVRRTVVSISTLG
jgi:hypothetical protein